MFRALRYALLLAAVGATPAHSGGAVQTTVEGMGLLAGAANACNDDVYLQVSNCAGAFVERRAKAEYPHYQDLFIRALFKGFYSQHRERAIRCSRLGPMIREQPFWLSCPKYRPQ
jgi:hypothetical protein